MSLIVAKKNGAHIHLVSDTKLTYPDSRFPEKGVASPGDGVIKITILSPHICIAFAGECEPAEKAVAFCRQIQYSVVMLKEHLLRVNRETQGKTEFILCVGFPEYSMYSIKDCNINLVPTAWIGSASGFNIFQQKALENKISSSDFDSILDDAMDHVLKSGIVPEVNGFRVSVSNEDNFFHYKNYMSTIVPARTYNLKEGEIGIIEIYGTPQEGGYSVNLCDNAGRHDFVAIHVRQGEFGVLYRQKEYGLLWPHVIASVDEHEFNEILFDQYGIQPQVLFSSLQKSYLNRGNKYFALNEFKVAEVLYEQGLKQNEEGLKSVLLFNRGLALLKLYRLNEAYELFEQASKIDIALEPSIKKILRHLYNGG